MFSEYIQTALKKYGCIKIGRNPLYIPAAVDVVLIYEKITNPIEKYEEIILY